MWAGRFLCSLAVLVVSIPASARAEAITFRVEVPFCMPQGTDVMLRSNRREAGVYDHDTLRRVGPTRFEGTFEVSTPRTSFRYKYSLGLCEGSICPGIEKALTFTGSGGDVEDRTLSPETTETDDHVFIWRRTLTRIDLSGATLGERPDEERVAFCGPYLSVSGPEEITIGFDSYDAGEVVLEFGLTPDYGTRLTRRGTHRNHFVLRDLMPGRVYHYRIVEDGVAREDRTFTAPHLPEQPFRFAFLGDTQFYGPEQREDTMLAVEQFMSFSPDLVLSAGDLVASERGPSGPGGWNYPEMARFSVLYGLVEPLMSRAPFMAAMGNHEEDVFYFWDAFAFPEPDAPAIDHYDFQWGSVHFTVLYTGTTDGYDLAGILNSQTQWLERTLEAADANPGVTWKVVLLHRGPLSQGANHTTDGMAFFESESATMPSWRALFERHRVDLVLAGHNHNFTLATLHGVRYVTSCSGAPVHPLREPWAATTRHAEAVCTADLFDVGTRTIAFEARRLDGSVIEEASFTLCHEDSDCGERESGCASETRWACIEGECSSTCIGSADAGDGGRSEDAGVDGGSDGGVIVDIDAGVEGEDANIRNDASSRRDAAIHDGSGLPASPSGCACRMGQSRRSNPWLLATLLALSWMLRGHRRPRARER